MSHNQGVSVVFLVIRLRSRVWGRISQMWSVFPSCQGVNDISMTSDVTGDISHHHLVKVEFGRFSTLKGLFFPFPPVFFRTESPSHFTRDTPSSCGHTSPVGSSPILYQWWDRPSQGHSEPPGVSACCGREQRSLWPEPKQCVNPTVNTREPSPGFEAWFSWLWKLPWWQSSWPICVGIFKNLIHVG